MFENKLCRVSPGGTGALSPPSWEHQGLTPLQRVV